MVGKYQIQSNYFTSSQKQVVTEWLLNTIKGCEWQEDADLHIDEIIEEEIQDKMWVDISLIILDFANQEILRLGFNNIIPIIFIPLYGDEQPRGINFKNLSLIRDELDMTPPSLFVCPKTWQGFLRMIKGRKWLYDVKFQSSFYKVYYYEEMHPNGLEHIRNLMLLPKERFD